MYSYQDRIGAVQLYITFRRPHRQLLCLPQAHAQYTRADSVVRQPASISVTTSMRRTSRVAHQHPSHKHPSPR